MLVTTMLLSAVGSGQVASHAVEIDPDGNAHTVEDGSDQAVSEDALTGDETAMYGSATYNRRSNSTWASPVDSYLEYDGSSLMRVQANSDSSIQVSYYNTSYQLQSSKTIAAELPRFGGFYASDSNYYIVSGQNNSNESASVECYRITKYDKNWNRLGSVGLFDCNTTAPFEAGSCRMVQEGKYLFVHTCHQMYTSSDGLRHQANLRIQVDTSTMTITDSYSSVMNISWGYCSHSFDQYVLVDDDHIVTLDHGDAYPRAAAVCVYKNNFSSGKFMSGWSPVEHYNALKIPGRTGANATGVSLGGFEQSDSAYLVAASSVPLDSASYSVSNIRNVVVSVVSKETGAATERWITDYTDASAVKPHLISIGSNEYMLLWMKTNADTVYYCKIDGEGNRLTDIKTKDAVLTSCKPAVVNGKLVWFENTNDGVNFYQIGIPGYKDPKISAFVTRLYNTCLGRTPDAGGLTGWHDVLFEGSSTGAQVGYGFVFSKEYLIKNTSNEEYVEMLYNVFLDRSSDASGKASWVSLLEQGISREYVFKGFVESAEYSNICNSYGINRGTYETSQPRDVNFGVTSFVSRLYTKALGRSFDADGLNAWCGVILDGSGSPEQVAENFINSQEFLNKNLSNEEYVKVLYRTFMGREYDQGGLDAWVSVLNSGTSRLDVLHGFSRSPEFAQIMAQYGL